MEGIPDDIIPKATEIPSDATMAKMVIELRRLRLSQDDRFAGYRAVAAALALEMKEYLASTDSEIERLTVQLASAVKGGARGSFPTLGGFQKKGHTKWVLGDGAGTALAQRGLAQARIEYTYDPSYKKLRYVGETGLVYDAEGEIIQGVTVEESSLWYFMPEKDRPEAEVDAPEADPEPKKKRKGKSPVVEITPVPGQMTIDDQPVDVVPDGDDDDAESF